MQLKFKRGDTLIEVAFAIAIFALVCVFSITLMNSGVDTAQSSMELTMARNEIDAQAEALRFIQNAHLSERELTTKEYQALWDKIKSLAVSPEDIDTLSPTPDACQDIYNSDNAFTRKAFVINTRSIDPGNVNSTIIPYSASRFAATNLYPRIIFTGIGGSNSDELTESVTYNIVNRVEGIGVIAVKGTNVSNPEFYDFHIRTCWYAPGRNIPSTINTIIRLYNPEYS